MSLTNEQIAAIMTKHITCKTVLVDPAESDDLIKKHIAEGWEIANQVECNGKTKITFRKVEKPTKK